MPVLDVRTIERLAELICDLDGPNARSVRQLQRFLEGAGWKAPYQGPQGRVSWLIEMIKAHNDDPEAIGALLRRVVDPREYEGSVADAETLVGPMNELLATDGFEVGLERGRPLVRRTYGDREQASLQQVAEALASPQLRATVRSLVSNPTLADILISRLDEVEAARNAGAFVLAIVGTGSFIEGLLDDVMKLRDPEIRKAETVTLDLLLKTAHRRGWIQPDAFDFSDIVRQYRNFVHPRAQQKRGITPDADTVLMCWPPVLAVVNDLDKRLPDRR
ncbi:MAG TPA: hypothetical protein VJ757_15170 [Pseudonocardiaceae bacterium]|nr:hypothetical protein [Pseudonocardiaceae bacterium]